MRRLIGLLVLAVAWTSSASAQRADAPAQPGPEVVVEGIRLPRDEASRAPATDLSGGDPRQSAVANRIQLEFSTRMAACAGRGHLSNSEQLRAAVDGMPNDATQRYEQGRVVQRNASCTVDPEVIRANATDAGGSLWDRGALTIEAMRRYAPDLVLTRGQTEDPAVQARLDAREVPRNWQRLPTDYSYFQAAICMVRLQPTLSVRLALDERSPASRLRIENAIVDGARVCLGNPKHVLFEPTQLRLYIADAVYRWAVAARGVDSLIPASVIASAR